MSDPSHWYHHQFSEEDVTRIQENAKIKQAEIVRKYGPFNHHSVASQYRWIGDAGEEAFQALMVGHYGYVEGLGMIRHTKGDDLDDKDFTISTTRLPIIIDVKTLASQVEPLPEYLGNLNAEQYEKIVRDNCPINTLVFCQYVIPTRTAIIIGWLLVSEFKRLAVFYRKGERSNKITIGADCYCISYRDTKPFSRRIDPNSPIDKEG